MAHWASQESEIAAYSYRLVFASCWSDPFPGCHWWNKLHSHCCHSLVDRFRPHLYHWQPLQCFGNGWQRYDRDWACWGWYFPSHNGSLIRHSWLCPPPCSVQSCKQIDGSEMTCHSEELASRGNLSNPLTSTTIESYHTSLWSNHIKRMLPKSTFNCHLWCPAGS